MLSTKIFAIVIPILSVLMIALVLIGSNINDNDKICLRNQTNTKWLDACCVKLNKTLEMGETYEIGVTLLMDEQFDMLMKTQIGKNATSVLNITSPKELQFASSAFCIDGFNTSELNGAVIDGQRIDAEKCSQIPKEITVKVKCQEATNESSFP